MAIDWTMILNPRAGGGRARSLWPKIAEALDQAGVRYTIMQTERREHATYLAQEAIKTGSRHILSLGGDGTANEVANGILRQTYVPSDQIVMGHIGAGTGNDWGRSTGFPAGHRAAAEALRNGYADLIDVGLVKYTQDGVPTERYFVNMAGLGFGAFAGEMFVDGGGGGGSMKYLSILLRSLLKFKPVQIKWWVDNAEHSGEIFSIALGNGKFNGGGMMQAPDASLTDGILDLTVIHTLSKFAVVRNLGRLYKGTFVKHPAVKQYKGAHFRFEGKEPLLFECDGEVLGRSALEFEVKPKALKFIRE